MESLQHLSIRSCNSLKQLWRKLPVSLKTMEITSCTNLKRLPDASNLKNLQEMVIDSDAEGPRLEQLKWLKGEYNDHHCRWRYEAENIVRRIILLDEFLQVNESLLTRSLFTNSDVYFHFCGLQFFAHLLSCVS